jgi:signal recognition particle GTPase
MTEAILDKKINDIAQRQVMGALREILSDPDFGLSLRTSAIQRLRKSVQSKKTGKYKNLKDILAKYCR